MMSTLIDRQIQAMARLDVTLAASSLIDDEPDYARGLQTLPAAQRARFLTAIGNHRRRLLVKAASLARLENKVKEAS